MTQVYKANLFHSQLEEKGPGLSSDLQRITVAFGLHVNTWASLVEKKSIYDEQSASLSFSFQKGVRGHSRAHANILDGRSVDEGVSRDGSTLEPLEDPAHTFGRCIVIAGRISISIQQRVWTR